MIYNFATMKHASVSFNTLDVICKELGVGVGDILQYVPDEANQ